MKTPTLASLKLVIFGVCLQFGMMLFNAQAIVYYWDPNGTTSVGGNGTWVTNTTPQWSTVSTQVASGSLVIWPPSGQLNGTNVAACFCAGPTGSVNQGTFTVSVNTAINCAGLFNGILNPAPCTLTLNGTGSLNFITGNDTIDTFNSTTTINIPISGPGVLVPEGSGTFYLNTTNTYTGGTLLGITGGAFTGVVNYTNGNCFGTGTITISNTSTGNCGFVLNATAATTITNAWACKAAAGVNIVGNTAGLTLSGPWVLTGSPVLGAGNSVGNLVNITGVMSGAGGLHRGLNNNGILRLSATNTYTGDTIITNGILQAGSTGAIPSGSGKGNVTVDENGTNFGILDVHGFTVSVNGLTGANGIITNSSGTGTINVGNNNVTSEFDGVIANTAGTLNLTKSGTGTFTIGGPNAYNGVTTINGGILQLGLSHVIPTLTAVTIASSASFDVNNTIPTIAGLNGAGSVINNGSELIVSNNLSTGNTVTTYSCFSGVLTEGSLLKQGTASMSLRGTNQNLNSQILVQGGILSVGAQPNCLPPSDTVVVSGGAIFQLDANTQTLTTLEGDGSTTGNVNLGGGQLIITGNPNNFSGTIQDSELPGASTAVGHGLRGFYFTNQDLSGLLAVRDDANVNFTDLTSASQLPAAIYPKTNNNSIRWVGQIQSTAPGLYTFTTTTDDGTRVWVNGTLVIDDWVSQSATAKSGTVTLAANTRYDIVMEYFNQTGPATAKLAWTPPGDTFSTAIPTDFLYLPTPGMLVVSNSGSLTLAGSNTYVGGTLISSGSITGDSANGGGLGAGNVIVNDGAALVLENTDISPTGDLILNPGSPSVDIEYLIFGSFGTNVIHGLSLDGGLTWQPAGTYGNSTSAAAHQPSQFTGSGNGVLLVTAGGATNVLAIAGGASTYGNSITLTSTVTGAGATPTGTVTFYDGASAIGTAPLVSGVAMLSVSDLQAITSPHSITAVYGGDASHATSTSATVSQTVNPLLITVNTSTVTISNKVYDATSTASVGIQAVPGVLANDTNNVHLTGTATFSDKTVGTGKTVNVTGLVLAGSLAGNYTLSATSTTALANITPKTLTVTGVTANAKPYDGTTNATLNTSAAAFVTIISGDVVTTNVSGATGTFANAAVANNVAVTVTGIVAGGTDGSNYSVTQPTGLKANITKGVSSSIIASSQNPSSLGSNVTFTATVSGLGATPTGTVTFLTNNVTLASGVALTAGVASASTANLPAGTNTITAQYTGDGNYVGITNSISQVVNTSASRPTLTINTTNSGASAVLTWTGAFSLQSSPSPLTNSTWTTIPGATSPFTNAISNSGLFFRLKQ